MEIKGSIKQFRKQPKIPRRDLKPIAIHGQLL